MQRGGKTFNRPKPKKLHCENCNEEIIYLQDALNSGREGFKRMCQKCWCLYDSDKLKHREWAIRKFTKEISAGFDSKINKEQ